MANIPQEKTIDNSIQLLWEGYPYMQKRIERFNSNIFKTRLLGQKVICIHGEEAAKIFYNSELFQRSGAIPKPLQESLFGTHSVHTLDGEAHKHRKAMLMSNMGPESIERLLSIAEKNWQDYVSRWEQTNKLVVLFEEAQEIYCKSICAWAGVPLQEEEVRLRTDDLMARIDSFGSAGLRYLRGRWGRQRTEKWICKVIEQIRSGELVVSEETPAYRVAFHKDLSGKLLETHTAAVALLNLIRPTIAISYYITFAALAIYEQPEYRQKLRQGTDQDLEMFVQEVRRYFPFAPFLGAKVRKNFEWQGHQFEEGRLVLLDIYGTLHDPELWEQPGEFRPERFLNWNGSPFDFIPQGGGDYDGHRCAGEWITIGLAKVGLKAVAELNYEVPRQNLKYDITRIPTFPASGFTIRNVKKVGSSSSATGSRQETAQSRIPVVDRQACPYHQTAGSASEMEKEKEG